MPEKTTEPSFTLYASQSKNYRVIFSNSFRLRMGESDMGLTFGYQTQRPAEGNHSMGTVKAEPVLIDEAEIAVTAVQLKYMSEVIRRGIAEFEARFGEIVLPAPMTAQFAAMDANKAQRK